MIFFQKLRVVFMMRVYPIEEFSFLFLAGVGEENVFVISISRLRILLQ